MASLGLMGTAALAVAVACLSAGCSSVGYYAQLPADAANLSIIVGNATQDAQLSTTLGATHRKVGPTYPLAESARAFQDILDRKTTGKVIIEPGR